MPIRSTGGAIAQGLHSYLEGQRQRRLQEMKLAQMAFPGADMARILGAFGGVSPEQADLLGGVSNIPPGLAQDIFKAHTSPPPPSTSGADFLSLLPPQLREVYQGQEAGVEGLGHLEPSTANRMIDTLTTLATRRDPAMIDTPEDLRGRGLPDQLTLSELGQARDLYPEADPNQFPFPEAVTQQFPHLKGATGNLEQIQQWTKLAQDLVQLGVDSTKSAQTAREVSLFLAESEGKFVDRERLETFLSKQFPGVEFFIPEPLEAGEFAGKVNMESVLDNNQILQDILRTATDTGLLATRTAGEELNNQLKTFQIESFWETHRETVENLRASSANLFSLVEERGTLLPGRLEEMEARRENLRASTFLDEQRAREIEALLPFRLDLLAQDIVQGDLDIQRAREDIRNLQLRGDIMETEAQYLEKALQLEIEAKEAQARYTETLTLQTAQQIQESQKRIEKIDQEILNLQSQLQLTDAKVREAESLLPYSVEEAAQRIARGELDQQKVRAEIFRLIQQGKIDQTTWQYLDRTLDFRVEKEGIQNQLLRSQESLNQSRIAQIDEEIGKLTLDNQYTQLRIAEAEALLPFRIEQAALQVSRGELDLNLVKQQISNLVDSGRVTRAQADFLEKTLDLRVEREELAREMESQQIRLTRARADEAESLLDRQMQKMDLEIDSLRENLEQGRTMGGLVREKMQAEIDNLRTRGLIDDVQRRYLESTLDWRAGLVELEFQMSQQEIGEFPVHLFWTFLNLPGEPPPGFKIRNYQVDQIARVLSNRQGDIVGMRDLMETAGMSTEGIPSTILDMRIPVDRAGELVRSIQGLKSTEMMPVRTFIDLAGAIVQAYAPDPVQDIVMLSYLQRRPDLAEQVISSRVGRLPPEMQDLVNRLLQRGLEGLDLGVEGGGGTPPVFGGQGEIPREIEESINQLLLMTGGDIDLALRVAQHPQNREAALSNPESPFYQNPELYIRYLQRLQQMAEGGF